MGIRKSLIMKSGFARLVKALLMAAILLGCDKDDPSSSSNNATLPVDFLSDQKYTGLAVEVVYVEGNQPTVLALNNLTNFLDQILNKPGGITVTQRSIRSTGQSVLTVDDIRSIEKSNRQLVTSGKTVAAWIYFADADYSTSTSDSEVLGIAYGASSIAVFEKAVKELGGGFNEPSVASLETTILTHEFGHLLGLVNNGTPMMSPHQDTPHAAHCTNPDCLMYYKAATHIVAEDILGNGVPQLDENCIADLKKAGGR